MSKHGNAQHNALREHQFTARYALFLDDIRYPDEPFRYTGNPLYLDEWITVRNYSEFVGYIRHQLAAHGEWPFIISLDHDLAVGHYHKSLQNGIINYAGENFDEDHNKTGYHCLQWLISYCVEKQLPLPNIRCHSMNPVGKENIEFLYNSYKRRMQER